MARSPSESREAGTAGDARRLLQSLPVDPSGLGGARHALSHWLTRARVAIDDLNDVLLASNEACINAVEHSGAPSDGAIALTATLDGSTVRIQVDDAGEWREPTPRPNRGHGLRLMRQVMDAVHIRREGGGTSVTLEKRVSFEEGAEGDGDGQAPSAATVAVGEIGEVRLATLRGEVDLAEAERIARDLEAATGPEVAAVVVDLSGVTYIDSSGVHLLFKLAGRRRTGRLHTRIVAPPGMVHRVLELTGMEKAVQVDATVAAALRAIEAERG